MKTSALGNCATASGVLQTSRSSATVSGASL